MFHYTSDTRLRTYLIAVHGDGGGLEDCLAIELAGVVGTEYRMLRVVLNRSAMDRLAAECAQPRLAD